MIELESQPPGPDVLFFGAKNLKGARRWPKSASESEISKVLNLGDLDRQLFYRTNRKWKIISQDY